jgi:hypothetical protein
VFLGQGTSCTPNPCTAAGACCLSNGTCAFILVTDCASQSGVYAGNDVSCATADCRACCLSTGECRFEPRTVCQARTGAQLQNAGVTCASGPCPGACCLPTGACADTTQSDCVNTRGGEFNPGGPCIRLQIGLETNRDLKADLAAGFRRLTKAAG